MVESRYPIDRQVLLTVDQDLTRHRTRCQWSFEKRHGGLCANVFRGSEATQISMCIERSKTSVIQKKVHVFCGSCTSMRPCIGPDIPGVRVSPWENHPPSPFAIIYAEVRDVCGARLGKPYNTPPMPNTLTPRGSSLRLRPCDGRLLPVPPSGSLRP